MHALAFDNIFALDKADDALAFDNVFVADNTVGHHLAMKNFTGELLAIRGCDKGRG